MVGPPLHTHSLISAAHALLFRCSAITSVLVKVLYMYSLIPSLFKESRIRLPSLLHRIQFNTRNCDSRNLGFTTPGNIDYKLLFKLSAKTTVTAISKVHNGCESSQHSS